MPTSCTDVSHSAALAQRQDHVDTSIRVGSFNIGMDQNTLTKREMDEMEAFPGKGLGLGFADGIK